MFRSGLHFIESSYDSYTARMADDNSLNSTSWLVIILEVAILSELLEES